MSRDVLPSCQPLQPPRRLIQCLRLFAERETYLLGSVFRMFVETRPRHACDSVVFHQVSRNLNIVCEPERADLDHNEISAPRKEPADPGFQPYRRQTRPSPAATVVQC